MTTNNHVPDFSDDDFANDPEIRKNRQAQKEYVQMVNSCIGYLKQNLQLEKSSHRNLHGFYSYKQLARPTILETFKSTSPFRPLHVSLVRYFSSSHTAKGTFAGTDDYLFGLLMLPASYPRTIIVKETLREKITDLLNRAEVDFPDAKKFSRRFYVLTENKERLKALLMNKQLDILADFPDMEAELNGYKCLFRLSRKCLSPTQTEQFAALAKTVCATLATTD